MLISFWGAEHTYPLVHVAKGINPNWPDLGLRGVYGRWAGVNWVWSLRLTIYHATISIAIPILLVELLFPARRDERWVGRRGMIGLSSLLAADVLLAFFVLTPYRPPLVPYLLTTVATVALFLLARRLPARWGAPRPGRVPRLLWFALSASARSSPSSSSTGHCLR